MSSVLIRSENVFVVGFLLIQQPQPNLVESHFKARTDFVNGHFVMRRLAIHVMPKGDKIVLVGKGYDAFRIGSWQGEQTFENVAHALA